MKAAELARLSRTLRQVGPGQVAHRLRLRGQRAILGQWPTPGRVLLQRSVPGAVGWPAGFRPLDAQTPGLWPGLAELADGEITLLGRQRPLLRPGHWRPADVPQLWRYHLHYWDWAFGLAAADNRTGARLVFARLWRSWSASSRFGRYDEWAPYVAALRAWALCGVFDRLVRGSAVEDDVRTSLGLHVGFLATHLERDVGGNHLIKDLKGLLGLAVFLGDDALADRATVELAAEVRRQVLPDGGHVERAPAYHCQVLADLIDVTGLLRAAGRAVPAGLDAAVEAMRRWLGVLLLPDGSVPILNDGFPVPAERLATLGPLPAPEHRLSVLGDSGYAVARVGRWHLVADVGVPCPPELPAHAHADTLSFLLWLDGQPLVVDTGVSTYAAGERRDYERSTVAHSTVSVDGEDSTEVYAAFRAGRRAGVRLGQAADDGTAVRITAEHDGYRHLPGSPVHRRSWLLEPARLSVTDEITGVGWHRVESRLIGAPGLAVTPDRLGAVSVRADGPLRVVDVSVGVGWEQRRPAAALVRQVSGALPVTLSTELAT